MFNLIRNALKLIFVNGHIKTAAKWENDKVQFLVSDIGRCISEKSRHFIFIDIFNHSNFGTSSGKKGSGLWQDIVKNRIDTHILILFFIRKKEKNDIYRRTVINQIPR